MCPRTTLGISKISSFRTQILFNVIMKPKSLTTRFRVEDRTFQESTEKSKYSCQRCRTAKRKCSKQLSGCFNCFKSGTVCEYAHRKSRIEPHIDENFTTETKPGTPVDDFKDFELPVQHENTNRFMLPLHQEELEPTPNFLLTILGFPPSLFRNSYINEPVLSKDVASKFIEAFFRHNHRSYPFINQAAFLTRFGEMQFLSNFVTDYNDFEIFMVMAIGCTTLSRAGLMEKEDNYSKYFSAKSMRFLSQEHHVSPIDSIKMMMLLCLYSFFEPRGIHSWNLFGLVSRAAISLGLNRGTNADTKDNEMRNRLFWSIYNMDRLLSTSFGRPLSLDEDNIDVPLPTKQAEETEFSFRTMLSIIKLRKIEGTIIKKLYSPKAKTIYGPEVIRQVHEELDEWIKLSPNTSENLRFLSFHGSHSWFLARYFHCLMLLYRPSYLVTDPDVTQLDKLSEYCLKTLSYTYKLFKANLLPLNWITLYRFLTLCSATLYCLCNWSIDFSESKQEIYLSVEILNAFSENWIFASKCSKVFQDIVDNILEISLTAGGGEVSRVKQLSDELLGASSAYHQILDDNSINMSFTKLFKQDFIDQI